MDAATALRDRMARDAALRRYAKAADHFAEVEQLAVNDGRYAEAEGAHVYGLMVLRAYMGEQNPDRVGPPTVYDPHDR